MDTLGVCVYIYVLCMYLYRYIESENVIRLNKAKGKIV